MKKEYTQAKIELLLLTTADVITGSVTVGGDGDDPLSVGWNDGEGA